MMLRQQPALRTERGHCLQIAVEPLPRRRFAKRQPCKLECAEQVQIKCGAPVVTLSLSPCPTHRLLSSEQSRGRSPGRFECIAKCI